MKYLIVFFISAAFILCKEKKEIKFFYVEKINDTIPLTDSTAATNIVIWHSAPNLDSLIQVGRIYELCGDAPADPFENRPYDKVRIVAKKNGYVQYESVIRDLGEGIKYSRSVDVFYYHVRQCIDNPSKPLK